MGVLWQVVGDVGANVACGFAAAVFLRQLMGLFWVCMHCC